MERRWECIVCEIGIGGIRTIEGKELANTKHHFNRRRRSTPALSFLFHVGGLNSWILTRCVNLWLKCRITYQKQQMAGWSIADDNYIFSFLTCRQLHNPQCGATRRFKNVWELLFSKISKSKKTQMYYWDK